MKIRYPVRRKSRFGRRKKEGGKRFKKPIPRIVVPSFFTLMNLFCGFLAIINISEGRLEYGAWLIVLAGLFDTLDGFMARISNATSDFGIELDSLSDVVSFGVASGFLIFKFGLEELQFVGVMVSALPPLCGAVRLARFNVEAHVDRPDFFRGLPIPAQAIMIAALFLAFKDRLDLFADMEYGFNSVLMPAVVLLSFLMVSTVPFDKIPKFDRDTLRNHKGRIMLFVFYLLIIIGFQEIGLIAVFTIFILKGLGLSAVRFFYDEEIGGEDSTNGL